MELREALSRYEAHTRAMGLESRTVKNRTQVIRRALEVWGDILVHSIEPHHINELFEGADYAPRTRNLYLGQLRKFFSWCQYNEYMGKKDPTFGWNPAKVASTERFRLPVEEFPALLDATKHPRDRAALAIAMYTFMRGSEIQSLRIRDLDLNNQTLRIYRHKTKEEDHLPVCSELADEMVRWLNYYRSEIGALDGKWFLVPSKAGVVHGHLGDQRWVPLPESGQLRVDQKMTHPYRVAQRALTELGYTDTKNEGIHTLRRSGARALLDTLRAEGTESALLRVGAMLGHKDTKVTAHYVGLNMEREQRNDLLAGRKMFPTTRQPGLRMVSNG